jgi:hypothetical protein
VLDIAPAAIDRARQRLGAQAASVRWIVADVTAVEDVGQFDIWHDRATFHFLIDPRDRARYVTLLRKTVPIGGHAIIATFAPDGPAQCSGLEVTRYDAQSLHRELGNDLQLLTSVPEIHRTPWGVPQSFQWALFRRRQ